MLCKKHSSSSVPVSWKCLTTLPTLEFRWGCLVTSALSWAEKEVMILEATQLFLIVRAEAVFSWGFLRLE